MIARALLFLFASLISTQVMACPYSEESFSRWMQTYFQSPDPDALYCSLEYYADSSLFTEHPNSRMPTAYFFASALPRDNFSSLYSLLSKDSSLKSKMFALHVFWVNGSSVTNNLIAKAGDEWNEPKIREIVGKMQNQEAWNPLLDGARSAADLDALWAIFFATGKAAAIRQISNVLPLLEEGHGMDIAVGGAARWSLTSNAQRYPEVRSIVIDLHDGAKGTQKELLQKVLDASSERPKGQSSAALENEEGGWVDRSGNLVPDTEAMKSNGGFGGWLVVTPDPDWEAEWATPSDHAPQFVLAKEVRVGEVLAILPLFINPKIDQDGFARIHCDIRIVRPDQSVSMEERDLNCFSYKLPGDPRSVWLSETILKYVGEPTDPKGEWEVEMVLRDMVREVEVPLKTSFTLLDD